MSGPLTPIQYACAVLVGRRYVWGAGKPSDARKGDWDRLAAGVYSSTDGAPRVHRGWECSGATVAALVTAGLYPALQPDGKPMPDITAHGLLYACDQIDIGKPGAWTDANLRPGDLLWHALPSRDGKPRHAHHVTLYFGHGQVLSMSGGDSNTFGDNPRACGRLMPFDYDRHLWLAARLKPEIIEAARLCNP